jgi:ubiquitin-conjugating enzyme E2 I
VKQVALGIQELLANPNEKSPAQSEAYLAYTTNRAAYEKRVKEEVAKYPPPE